jgi:hypothetical protein
MVITVKRVDGAVFRIEGDEDAAVRVAERVAAVRVISGAAYHTIDAKEAPYRGTTTIGIGCNT